MTRTGEDEGGLVSLHRPLHASLDALPVEELPRATAAELEHALAAGRVGAWHLNLATGVLTASDMCKANFGLPPDAALTLETGMRVVHEDDRPLVQRALDAALAGATEYDIEHRVVWPDGSIHWIHARGSVIGPSQPHCLHGVTVDITRPRRAEALALAQNALLERVALGHPRAECLRAVNDAIAALDPHVRGCFVLTDARRTRVIEAVAPFPADAIAQLFAMPVGNASFGTCCAAICHNRPFASRDIEQDDAWQAEWRALCLAHGVRAAYSVPVLRPNDGVAIGSFCMCLDEARPPEEWETQIAVFGAQLASTLVERDRVIEALHAGEAQLARELADARILHEVSVELVAEDDVAEIYEKIVDAACAIMHSQCASLQMRHGPDRLQLLAHRGFTPKAAQGWQWVEASCATSCGQALSTGRRISYSDVRTMVDTLGPELLETYRDTGIVAIQTTPLKSRTGRVVGMLSTHWAYPHHPSEHELRLLDILARLAADLIERRQTDSELREGDRRKDEFLAMLGHELRNPLAPLRNALHLLRMEGAASGDDRALYDMMDRQLNQLVRLVDDLLEVSRITRGHIELRRRHSALSDIVTTAAETSRPLLDAYGHRFSIDLPEQPVVLDVDPIRIAQVLSNLLNNAAKYTPAGGNVVLRARIAGGKLRISVIDDGTGVDPRQQAAIFELFTQGEHRRHQARGGLGIGLTLARNLVLLHGGAVSVQSEGIGKGSEFIVELPLSDARAAVGEPDPPRIEPSARSRRILIVDDNSAHADSLAQLLSLGGHEAHTVYDGDDALSVFEAIAPDVVLLDLGMPGMDGCEVCRRLRALPSGRDIVIIAVTGWGQQADRARTAAFGFDAHLVKPVNPLEILQRLEAA
jgi:signal transduction histidine kinase